MRFGFECQPLLLTVFSIPWYKLTTPYSYNCRCLEQGLFFFPHPPALDDWEGPGESGYLGCGSEKERWGWEGERREGSGPEPVEED